MVQYRYRHPTVSLQLGLVLDASGILTVSLMTKLLHHHATKHGLHQQCAQCCIVSV